MCDFSIIAAVSKIDNGIGKNGELPWNIPEDLQFFQKITKTTNDPNKCNAIIMGRNTFHSIGRPLPGRLNVCISTSYTMQNNHHNVIFLPSLHDALDSISRRKDIEKVFVIGGEILYNEAIKNGNCKELFINEIHDNAVECDRFFPNIDLHVFELAESFNLCYNVNSLRYVRCSK
jgi:dihydrofolate reductase/thymidylate synthase